jgi:hypothetical protein
MTNPQGVIVDKVVPISEAQLAQAVHTPLSETVQQIIVASGVQSLQALVGNPAAVTEAVKAYWNLE